jgi:hypothetical protein
MSRVRLRINVSGFRYVSLPDTEQRITAPSVETARVDNAGDDDTRLSWRLTVSGSATHDKASYMDTCGATSLLPWTSSHGGISTIHLFHRRLSSDV